MGNFVMVTLTAILIVWWLTACTVTLPVSEDNPAAAAECRRLGYEGIGEEAMQSCQRTLSRLTLSPGRTF